MRINSFISSASMGILSSRSLFCLKGFVPSAFVGRTLFELRTTIEIGFNCFFNLSRLVAKKDLSILLYFIMFLNLELKS